MAKPANTSIPPVHAGFRPQERATWIAQHRYGILVFVSPAAIILAWDLATRFGLIRSDLLPPPLTVLASLIDVLRNGYAGINIFVHVGASLTRVLTAFIAAPIVGIILGLLRGRYRSVDAVCLVPAEVIRPIPPLGLIPLFILWFGIGELSKILIIFYYVALIVMLNTQSGVRSCPDEVIRAALSLGASPFQVFRYVILPAALPQIMTGLRVGMGSALAILVASELLGGDRGLGFVILDASNFFRTNEVFVGIILIGLLGLITDRGLTYVSRKLVHWEGKK
jgi:ABC-type nitrate/sulfonate/bicarbonate transport system permease component